MVITRERMAAGQESTIIKKLKGIISKSGFSSSSEEFESQIRSGERSIHMPAYPIPTLLSHVRAATTGPGTGITALEGSKSAKNRPVPIAVSGIQNWFCPSDAVDGVSVSLYDRKASSSQERSGDPNADVFAAVARDNNCVMVIADGCNWGDKARLAAKSAAMGCMEYINSKLYSPPSSAPTEGEERGQQQQQQQQQPKLFTVQDLFSILLRSFDEAHKCILANGGTTTTLTAAIVCPLAQEGGCPHQCGACVVSVGDSQAYLYRRKTRSVHEITRAVHQGERRDMRDSGGCLGSSCGEEPDLRNLLCNFCPVSPGDLVFLTTDGLSDNFDPVVRRAAEPDEITESFSSAHIPLPSNCTLPVLTAEERESSTLATMAEVITGGGARESVNSTLLRLLEHVLELTDQKRTYLEKVLSNVEECKGKERREMDKIIKSTLKQLPGKLDHCSMVGCAFSS